MNAESTGKCFVYTTITGGLDQQEKEEGEVFMSGVERSPLKNVCGEQGQNGHQNQSRASQCSALIEEKQPGNWCNISFLWLLILH